MRQAIFPAQLPDVAQRRKLKIHLGCMLIKRRQQRIAKSLGKSEHADPHAVIRAQNACIACRAAAECDSRAGNFQKGTPRSATLIYFVLAHFNAPALRSNSLVPAMLCREDSSV